MRGFVDLAHPRRCARSAVSVLVLRGTSEDVEEALFPDLCKAWFAGGALVACCVHLRAMLGERLAFLPFSTGVLPKEITWVALRTVEGILCLVDLAVHLFLETQLSSVMHFLFVSASTGIATRIV